MTSMTPQDNQRSCIASLQGQSGRDGSNSARDGVAVVEAVDVADKTNTIKVEILEGIIPTVSHDEDTNTS